MPNRTSIEWADYSSNPLKARLNGKVGWACVHAGDDCRNCYAEALNRRWGTGLEYVAKNIDKVEHFLDCREMERILTFRPKGPFKGGTARPKLFLCDMTDLFGPWVSDDVLDQIFALAMMRPDVDFLLLTKQAQRMHEYVTGVRTRAANRFLWPALLSNAACIARDAGNEALRNWFNAAANWSAGKNEWPLPNVWLIVSAGYQKALDERGPWLLQTPAAVRGFSFEPLLEEIDAERFFWRRLALSEIPGPALNDGCTEGIERRRAIQWAIIGGESGRGARPSDVSAVRSLLSQCRRADIDPFVKQLGSKPFSGLDRISHRGGTKEKGMPDGFYRHLNDSKGGDPEEWPEDLRVREFPEVRA